MPIDARIPLTGNALQIDNPLDVYGKGMQIAGYQRQNKLADLTMGQKQAEIESANALSRAYAAAVKADGTVDRNALRANLAKSGQGSAIPGVNTQFSAEDKAALEARDAELKHRLGFMSYVSQRLSAATAENLAAIRQEIAASDPNLGPQAAANIPQTFDPVVFKGLIDSGIPIIEQHKQAALESAAKLAQANQEANRAVVIRGQDLASRDRQDALKLKTNTAGDKPMPATALKMQNDALDVLATASGTQASLSDVEKKIDSGKLDFGLFSNWINSGRNALGVSSEESKNFGDFKSKLEKLRNDSLRLNSGVQTDGDAQRAWNELFSSINDKELVRSRLATIKSLNERAVQIKKGQIDLIRGNYGNAPLDTSGFEAPADDGGADIFSAADAILGGP